MSCVLEPQPECLHHSCTKESAVQIISEKPRHVCVKGWKQDLCAIAIMFSCKASPVEIASHDAIVPLPGAAGVQPAPLVPL